MIREFKPKDPDEVDFFNIDFTDRMPPDDTISTVVTVFLASGDTAMTIDQFAYSGKVVSGRWQGGTRGTSYTITARITTLQGRTLDKSGLVLVADQ
jgi:hypothetical protein